MIPHFNIAMICSNNNQRRIIKAFFLQKGENLPHPSIGLVGHIPVKIEEIFRIGVPGE